jgi:serine/threonine protein kinase
MAPEQTGRMNRSIDSRSDLYSLGVTYYEMLVGGLPFTAGDAMEWIHCHIARLPVSPSARANGIPGAISAIVMKLLAKSAEERFQTATGVEADMDIDPALVCRSCYGYYGHKASRSRFATSAGRISPCDTGDDHG